MSSDATVPERKGGFPIRAIRVEELDGTGSGRVLISGADRVTIGSARGNDLVLEDPAVSRYHVVLGRSVDRISVHDLGSTNGTRIGPVEVRGTQVDISPGAVLRLGSRQLRIDDGAVVLLEVPAGDSLSGIRGRSGEMRRLMASIERAAKNDVSVLLIGESGTGKELAARAIHDLSARREGPFEIVDCAAIPATLFAAELFGNERGAFTGADRRRPGALERAQGGTVFFDEVGELPTALQASLLGALERRVVRRLGSDQELPIDVRVVCATNRDLRSEVNAGVFRLDLFYRLAVVLLELPTLRQRRDDIPLLIDHFLAEAGHAGGHESVFTPDALRELMAYSFPGNVRELRNVVASALALGTQPTLPSVPPPAGQEGRDMIEELFTRGYKEARSSLLQEFERRYLSEILQRSQGNVRRAARAAGMDRSYLTELLARHGLGRFKSED